MLYINYRFPKDPELRKEWIQRINVEFCDRARVCSKHFTNDCFSQSPWSSRRVLKSDAVPNVIVKAEPHSEENASSSETENTLPKRSLMKKRKAYVGDFHNLDILSDKDNYINVVNATIAKKNKIIKTLHQKNKRLKQKVKDLYTLLEELKNNGMR